MAQHFKKLLLGGLTFCIGAVTLSKSVYIGTDYILRVSATPKDAHFQAESRDLQQVDVNVSLSYKPDEDKLADIYKKFGSRYADAILPMVGHHASKDARYDASDLLERKEVVVNEIREEFIAKSKRFDILLDNVSITLAVRDIPN